MGYNYNYNSSQFTDKDYIPRLLFLNLNWTLADVHKHVFLLYSFLLNCEDGGENDLYNETYQPLI